jgi:hypothetical protein
MFSSAALGVTPSITQLDVVQRSVKAWSRSVVACCYSVYRRVVDGRMLGKWGCLWFSQAARPVICR